MIVTYKCKCMNDPHQVTVPDRTIEQTASEWLGGPCRTAITCDHCQISPDCNEPAMQWVNIPVNAATGYIGSLEPRNPQHDKLTDHPEPWRHH